jgi:hypothetical protein
MFFFTSSPSSLNSSNMDDDDNSDNNLIIDTSSLTLPIIEDNEKLFSSLSSNTPIISTIEIAEKVIINEENENNHSSQVSNLDPDQIHSPLNQSHSPQTTISTVIDTIITQIESNNLPFNCLPIIEDDQMEGEDDDDDDDEDEDNEDDEEEETEEQEYSEKLPSNKIIKNEKEQTMNKSSLTTKGDLKPITRTLRSHARKKSNLSTLNQTSSSNSNNNIRRVSNRRRALENKLLLAASEKNKKRRTLFERSKKDKESTNDEIHTSSNSDDQTTEPTNGNIKSFC